MYIFELIERERERAKNNKTKKKREAKRREIEIEVAIILILYLTFNLFILLNIIYLSLFSLFRFVLFDFSLSYIFTGLPL